MQMANQKKYLLIECQLYISILKHQIPIVIPRPKPVHCANQFLEVNQTSVEPLLCRSNVMNGVGSKGSTSCNML